MQAPILLRIVLTSLGFLFLSHSAHALSILIDFGAATAQTNHISRGGTDPINFWNNVTSVNSTNPWNLVDTTNAPTGISLVITSRFGGINENGTPDPSAPYVTSTTRDSFYGNTEEFSGNSNLTPSFTLSGLDPASTYNFRFYASRMGVNDIRTTDYFVSGAISGMATLNVANNISNTATVLGIAPDIFGNIQISLTASADNNNANHFTYLGTLEIVAVPEPASVALLMMAGTALVGLRRRRSA